MISETELGTIVSVAEMERDTIRNGELIGSEEAWIQILALIEEIRRLHAIHATVRAVLATNDGVQWLVTRIAMRQGPGFRAVCGRCGTTATFPAADWRGLGAWIGTHRCPTPAKRV